MANVYVTRCQGCDLEQQIIGRNDYAYRLVEPPDVFLWAQFAWCHHCREMVRAEKLLMSAEIDEWITGSADNRIRQDMERYWQMMASRRSPARCLECGSADILAASGNREERLIPHPDCGANIILHHSGFVRLGGHTDVYSPEGEHVATVDGILVPGRGY